MDTLEDIILKKELAANAASHKTELATLLKEYDMYTLGDEMQEQRIRDAYEEVLADNTFRAADDCPKVGVHKGDRILEKGKTWLLSQEDFSLLYSYVHPRLVARGIVKEDDTYVVPWSEMKVKAHQKAVDYTIENILPKAFRPLFRENRLNYVKMEKLLKIARSIAA